MTRPLGRARVGRGGDYRPNLIERSVVLIVGGLIVWGLMAMAFRTPDPEGGAIGVALVLWCIVFKFGVAMREQAFTLECDGCAERRRQEEARG